MTFLEKLYQEDILWLEIGHATCIDRENMVWSVYDYTTDEQYLLQDDELYDLEPLIDVDFYRLRFAIKECEKRHKSLD